eukprot:15081429-Alexandrium_andersonii.AAC.1
MLEVGAPRPGHRAGAEDLLPVVAQSPVDLFRGGEDVVALFQEGDSQLGAGAKPLELLKHMVPALLE